MPAFFFNAVDRVLLVRLGEAFSADELREVHRLGRLLVNEVGRVPSIVDFTSVTRVELQTSVLAALASAPPLMGELKRVFVASGGVTYGLARLFLTNQTAAGFVAPDLVRTLDEACRLLGVAEARFQPWAPDVDTLARAGR
jgi:hypothetical protein